MWISLARRGSFLRALAPLLLAGALLAGCGTPTGIQVQREARIPPDSAGARFIILSARGQDRDPGHAQDAELVAAEPVARHFMRVTEPAEARFAVMVWDRRGGGPAEDTRPVQVSSSESSGRGGRGGMGGGQRSRTQSTPRRDDLSDRATPPYRRVEIQIYDLTRSEGLGQHVFNADARVSGGEAGARQTAELITAALRDFPGSGSQHYSVP